ncbi:MAG: acetyl-CoA carboxylase carboxyl transferase subunit alpha, partial [Candidatus Dormibacteraceae bacterium]
DRVLMLRNATYSVAAPEAAASIVWRDNSRKVEAAQQLQLTSGDLLAMGLVEEVIAEPEGGAHLDPDLAATLLDEALWRNLEPLLGLSGEHLLEQRYDRYRYIDSLVGADPRFGPKVEPR